MRQPYLLERDDDEDKRILWCVGATFICLDTICMLDRYISDINYKVLRW
jgi:hypothetical protein